MTDRNLIILASIAGVLLLITVILYAGWDFSGGGFRSGTALIQGLEPDKIGSIIIESNGEKVTLARRDDGGFAVTEKNNYPASLKKINELLINCLEIRLAERVSEAPGSYGELGLAADSKEAISVTFKDAGGKELIGFVKGKSLSSGSGAYVRLAGKNTVFSTENFLSINTTALDYIDKELISVQKADIEEVYLKAAGNTYTIALDENEKIVLQNIPEDKRMKDKVVEDVFGALTSLNMTDVTPLDGLSVKWGATYRCRLASGLIYVVRSAELEKKHYIRISAKGPKVKEVRVSAADSDEDLKKKEAILLAGNEAKAFNEQYAAWAFKVSKYTADKLRKPLSKLLKNRSEDDSG